MLPYYYLGPDKKTKLTRFIDETTPWKQLLSRELQVPPAGNLPVRFLLNLSWQRHQALWLVKFLCMN
jgi:hypothetical protein